MTDTFIAFRPNSNPEKRLEGLQLITDFLWQTRHVSAALGMTDVVASIMKIIVYDIDPEARFLVTECMPGMLNNVISGE